MPPAGILKKSPPLHELETICVDDDGNWYRPEYPKYKLELAKPKPFLVPGLNKDEVIEVLPSEKQNKKIFFDENVHVMEIENRFQMMDEEELDDDDSYEIEIVENEQNVNGGGAEDDADFYLEMIDGEIFYVFETEDDISVDDDEYDSSSEEEESITSSSSNPPAQLDIGGLMMAPNLSNSFAQLDFNDMIVTNDNDNDKKKQQDGDDDQQQQQRQQNDQQQEEKPQQQQQENIQEQSPAQQLPPKIPSDKKEQGKEEEEKKTSEDNNKVDVDNTATNAAATAAVGKYDTPPVSPRRTISGPINPAGGTSSQQQQQEAPPTPDTPRSILKANPPSPCKKKKSKDTTKEKKEKGEKDPNKEKKSFTKTFVRASDFDGEHRVYSWAKPTWTNKQLKSTGKGDDVREGKNLAQPITDAKQLIEKGKVKWEKPEWAVDGGENEENTQPVIQDVNAKDELIRKIQDGSVSLPGFTKRRLKLSINGSILQEGGDIVKPITKATIIKKPSNINTIANPKILRATPGGSKIWKGEDLSAPVTQATTIKKYEFEKPSWVNAKLKHSSNSNSGDESSSQEDVEKNKKKIEWEKPEWAKRDRRMKIHRTQSAPINELKKEYKWEKPSWAKPQKSKLRSHSEDQEEEHCGDTNILKKTDYGSKLRSGVDIARPITKLEHLVRNDSNENNDNSNNHDTTTTTTIDNDNNKEEEHNNNNNEEHHSSSNNEKAVLSEEEQQCKPRGMIRRCKSED